MKVSDVLHIDEMLENSSRDVVSLLTDKRLTFGHIVNHREPKGTRFVLDAVHQARMAGADFSFLFGERLSHRDAMDLYRRVDVLLEQFVIGWYGLQACEFALMGKPVVVYLNPADRAYVPDDLWKDIPFINSPAWELAGTIKKICDMDRDALQKIGWKGRDFVRKWHDKDKIADRILSDLAMRT